VSPDIRIFNQIFSDTTNSYKFLWFLAILDHLKDHPDARKMTFEDLTVRMVQRAWYPMNTFLLSFGSQDSISKVIANLLMTMNDSTNSAPIFDGSQKRSIQKTLSRWVPYRFIRPFFERQTRGLPDTKVNAKISQLSQADESVAPYLIFSDHLLLKDEWATLFLTQFTIFSEYAEHQLCRFLQKHNPNVPGIIHKLHKPETRNLRRQRELWISVFKHHSQLTCLYSNRVPDNIAVDHFLPWTFTTHDLCWNLVGCDPISNIQKSNSLPPLNRYLELFAARQHIFFTDVFAASPNNKLLEDYVTLFKTDCTSIASLERSRFSEILGETIRTQHQIAKGMGFREGWG
jgi:hypothetical protein